MTDNVSRAEWASYALDAFERACGGSDAAEIIQDLIADLGHYADQIGLDFKAIAECGVGDWSAERRAPDGEPNTSDTATIIIEEKD